MKNTFRTRIFAVVTAGGAYRLFDQKSHALTHVKGLRDMGVEATLWRGKPTWRRVWV